MRIVLLAYHTIGHALLDFFLRETSADVVAVYTHEDAPGEEIWWPSVAALAHAHGVPTFTTADINAPDAFAQLQALRPDFIFSAWYRTLIKRPILDLPPGGCLNLHGSLLPRYRGRVPVQWALIHGERQTGMTLHYMVERADAGDIVGQTIIPMTLDDTGLSVYEKLVPAARDLLREAWPLLQTGTAPRLPQDETLASTFGRRTPADGLFSWWWPALRIHDLVRAVAHPYPGAFVRWQGRQLLVWQTTPLAGRLQPARPHPGTVLAIAPDGLTIATGAGALCCHRLQVAGADELDGAAFAACFGLKPGDVLAP